jgi:hypothetical protein
MSNLAKKQNVATEQTATMEIVKHAPSNGSAVVIEEAVAEVVAEEKAPVIVPEVKAVIVPNLSQRIEKVEELNITIAKYRQLQVARKGITNFRLGADGLSSTLQLKDADGQPFTTSNPVVVEAALAHIRQVLNEKIAECENEINFSI